MAYIAGYGCTIALTGHTWVADVTSFRQKTTKRRKPVKVCGTAYASNVTGTYHTTYSVGIAISSTLGTDDIKAGATAELTFTYATGDTYVATVIITDAEVSHTVEGAIVGTLELAANSALVHTVA